MLLQQGDNPRWTELRETAYLPYEEHRGLQCFVGPSLSRIATQTWVNYVPSLPYPCSCISAAHIFVLARLLQESERDQLSGPAVNQYEGRLLEQGRTSCGCCVQAIEQNRYLSVPATLAARDLES